MSRNPITSLFVFSLFLCAEPSRPQEPAAVSEQTVRISVERVNVGVIVTDNRGKLVEGLSRENFHVTDNGAVQPITDFLSIDQPAQVLMLVEAGPAVYLIQDAHLFVADSLLGGLSPGDRIALVRYNDAPLALLDFTTDKRMAQSALDQIQFNLGYGQLNLSSSLNTVLDWLARVPGKKTVLLISTGVDTSPEPMMQALLGRLRVDDVRTLCISMSGPLRNGKDGTKRQRVSGSVSADRTARAPRIQPSVRPACRRRRGAHDRRSRGRIGGSRKTVRVHRGPPQGLRRTQATHWALARSRTGSTKPRNGLWVVAQAIPRRHSNSFSVRAICRNRSSTRPNTLSSSNFPAPLRLPAGTPVSNCTPS